MKKVTVSLYLYNEPVLETYWSSQPAAETFAHKAITSGECQAVLIWKGEGKEWPGEDPAKWEDPDLLFSVVKKK
jgi:hypothetical protein